MKKIIIFPGQGYQNIQMLNIDVQTFCYEHNLGKLLDEVLKDNSKLFDTEYAQPIIIATQLVELEKYKSLQPKDIEYIYSGFSLGEITALIASGAISINDGLNFAKQRGILCKKFSQKNLQFGISTSTDTRTFSVAKIPFYIGLEEKIKSINLNYPVYERISITNYIPTNSTESKQFVTITDATDILKSNIESLGGSKEQKTAIMQCPFHSQALLDLIPEQVKSFHSCVKYVNSENLSSVISTRTALTYNNTDSNNDINKSLGKYLIEPMQTEKTLIYINEHYPDSEILVTMGKAFSKNLAEQYEVIGGKKDNVLFIQDVNKDILHNSSIEAILKS